MNENEDNVIQFNPNSIEPVMDMIEDPEADALSILGALMAMPDADFEIIKPVIIDALNEAYSDPQQIMTIVQQLGRSGLSIEDIVNHSDELIEEYMKEIDIELSETKKDLIRQMFVSSANAISSSTINPAHTVKIPVEICRENAKLPNYSTMGSAAMDIYSPEEYTIECGETKIIPTGIKVAIPHGYALLIQPRSGMSARTKLRIPNTPGLIDEDYHEEIGVIVENSAESNENHGPITIGKGERFAQMRLIEVPRVMWSEVSSLGGFKEDHGAGFGSTGKD